MLAPPFHGSEHPVQRRAGLIPGGLQRMNPSACFWFPPPLVSERAVVRVASMSIVTAPAYRQASSSARAHAASARRDALSAIRQHHRQIPNHPARILSPTPLLDRRQPR
jgi:hypothetical protein